jgi:hypothetical protein
VVNDACVICILYLELVGAPAFLDTGRSGDSVIVGDYNASPRDGRVSIRVRKGSPAMAEPEDAPIITIRRPDRRPDARNCIEGKFGYTLGARGPLERCLLRSVTLLPRLGQRLSSLGELAQLRFYAYIPVDIVFENERRANSLGDYPGYL